MIKDVIIHYIDISEPPGVTARNGQEIQVRLGVPEDHSSLKNAPEFDWSSFYVTTGTGNTGCLVAQELGSEKAADKTAVRSFHVNVPETELTELRRSHQRDKVA